MCWSPTMRRLLVVSALAGLLALPAQAADDTPPGKSPTPTVLLLGSQEPDTEFAKNNAKLLVREIVRQAVLIAARDELGLSTRDMTMRESVSAESDKCRRLDVQVAEKTKEFVRVRLTRPDGEVIYEKEIPLPKSKKRFFDYYSLVVAAEELSRTELVDALRKAGFSGEPNPQQASVAVPAATEQALREMNFFSQFAALRELHRLQQTKGESPQTLAALARIRDS